MREYPLSFELNSEADKHNECAFCDTSAKFCALVVKDMYCNIRYGGTVKYYFISRYLTSFIFPHYKCHRGENRYFKLKAITETFAEVVSDAEITNFCIASFLKSVIYYANELHIYYTCAIFNLFPEQIHGDRR